MSKAAQRQLHQALKARKLRLEIERDSAPAAIWTSYQSDRPDFRMARTSDLSNGLSPKRT
jgi:hypothetical protein